MANLKRTYIELVKNPEGVNKGDEPEIEKVWTPAFVPWRLVRQAAATLVADEDTTELEMIDKMEEFIVNDIYNGRITIDDLRDRLHAPDGAKTLQGVIEFISDAPQQEEESKKFLEEKNR